MQIAREKAPNELQIAHDRKLARRMVRGDERAIQTFCEQNLAKLYRFAKNRLPSEHDVDDVVQVVLTNAARRIETYRGEASLYTWLCQICRREVAKHIASRTRHAAVLTFSEDSELDDAVHNLPASAEQEPDAVTRRAELIAAVQHALDRLPDHYAEALELKYIDGFSSKEIAQRFGLADEATQSLLARARRAFRELCDIEPIGSEYAADDSERNARSRRNP
jgi:RNA polymerase sigma-70 factor (ECF subfamily)